MADDVTQLPDLLDVRRVVTFASVPTELLDDAYAFGAAIGAWEAMTPEEREAARREREAEEAVARAQAQADWQATRDRLAGNPQALAALDLHHPTGDGWPHCVFAESEEYDTEWPCATYTAIKEA